MRFVKRENENPTTFLFPQPSSPLDTVKDAFSTLPTFNGSVQAFRWCLPMNNDPVHYLSELHSMLSKGRIEKRCKIELNFQVDWNVNPERNDKKCWWKFIREISFFIHQRWGIEIDVFIASQIIWRKVKTSHPSKWIWWIVYGGGIFHCHLSRRPHSQPKCFHSINTGCWGCWGCTQANLKSK